MPTSSLPAGVIEPHSSGELAGVVPVSEIAGNEAYHYITYVDNVPTFDAIRHLDDPIAVVKLFGPGPGTWWIASYDPDRRMAWGAAFITNFEFGPIDMRELCASRIPPFRLPIERDLYWTPALLSEIAAEFGQ